MRNSCLKRYNEAGVAESMHFERHDFAALPVAGFVNNAHAAAAYFAQELVAIWLRRSHSIAWPGGRRRVRNVRSGPLDRANSPVA